MHPFIQTPAELEHVLNETARAYELGEVQTHRSLGGLDAHNEAITTPQGTFVVKLFAPNKPRTKMEDNIQGLLEFRKAGIPVPQLQTIARAYLFSITLPAGAIDLCVTDYFEGKDFRQLHTTRPDLREIAGYLAHIHTLNFDIQPANDPWGTAQFLRLFESNKGYLEPTEMHLVGPIVQDFSALDMAGLPQSVIHGDLHRQHVLKNEAGQYCLLDLGFIDRSASVLDLAIAGADFFPTLPKEDQHYFIQAYDEQRRLTPEERRAFPVLLKATYAAYLLGAQYCIHGQNDTREEIIEWARFARKGLESKFDLG